MNVDGASGLASLPPELWTVIAAFLGSADAARFRCSCETARRWVPAVPNPFRAMAADIPCPHHVRSPCPTTYCCFTCIAQFVRDCATSIFDIPRYRLYELNFEHLAETSAEMRFLAHSDQRLKQDPRIRCTIDKIAREFGWDIDTSALSADGPLAPPTL